MTSGRGREQEPVNGRGGGSRQASPGRPRSTHDRDREQDRRTDGSRDRSRERHYDRDRERDRERQRGLDREREHETHRRGDRDREKEWDRDRGGTDKGGRAAAAHRDERPSSRGDKEGREMDRSRGPRPEQQQERFAEPPRRDREHSHRDTRGAAGSSRQQQQRRDQPPEGKPKWGKPGEPWALQHSLCHEVNKHHSTAYQSMTLHSLCIGASVQPGTHKWGNQG